MILLPGEHLEISEDIFGCHKWSWGGGGGLLLASGG